MASSYSNVFTNEDVHYLNHLPDVLAAKASLDATSAGVVYFSVCVTDSIRDTLTARFGLDIAAGSEIPMRWIKGDTAPHMDKSASAFDNTYLLYLNDSPGELVVDSQRYPIQANTGFVFNEGLSHETQHTEYVPRLLLGPMNELAEPVGANPTTRYYIRLTLPSTGVIFTGFFDIDNYTNIVQTFYDSTNPTVNIRSYGNNGEPTYMYRPGWLCFDGGGCNVTSFPYFYGVTQGDYNLYGSTDSSINNHVDSNGNVTFEFSLTPLIQSIAYYPTEADALATTNSLGNGTSYVVGGGGPFGSYTSWKLASNSTGSSSQITVYVNGNTLNADGYYYLYPSAPCFLEGTTVLCLVDGVENYIPIQTLKRGTLVKTRLHGYKPVLLLGKGTIHNPGNDERTEDRLYKYSPSVYPDLKEDLYITGCHSILEYPITDKQMEDTINHLGKLFITDNKYRLMAHIDERAEPWNAEGEYTIWHVALEHADERMNYGVYVNGGLLVESCSINFLKNKSNMIVQGSA